MDNYSPDYYYNLAKKYKEKYENSKLENDVDNALHYKKQYEEYWKLYRKKVALVNHLMKKNNNDVELYNISKNDDLEEEKEDLDDFDNLEEEKDDFDDLEEEKEDLDDFDDKNENLNKAKERLIKDTNKLLKEEENANQSVTTNNLNNINVPKNGSEIEMSKIPKIKMNKTRKNKVSGFSETLKPSNKPQIKQFKNPDICQIIFKDSSTNNKFFYPSEFPNLTKINQMAINVKEGINVKGGTRSKKRHKKKRKTRKTRKI